MIMAFKILFGLDGYLKYLRIISNQNELKMQIILVFFANKMIGRNQ